MEVGQATSSKCPKGGYVWLTTKAGRDLVVPTKCKTWGCKGCRDRAKAKVQEKIQYGCSILGRCVFITLTFRRVGANTRNADFVAASWARFWKGYHKQNPGMKKKIAWFRIVELTRANQPHLHLIVAGLGGQKIRAIEKEWSMLWLHATGDSYIVDAREVLGPAGAAAYLTKYLLKGAMDRDELVSKGFKRRYSRSRTWPSADVHLAGGDDGWARSTWTLASLSPLLGESQAKASRGHPALALVGDQTAITYLEHRRSKQLAKKAKTLLERLRNNDH